MVIVVVVDVIVKKKSMGCACECGTLEYTRSANRGKEERKWRRRQGSGYGGLF